MKPSWAWFERRVHILKATVTGSPDPFHAQSITPHDVVVAIKETWEHHPILYGIIPEKLLDDMCVKMLKRLYGLDFSKPK